MCPQDPGRVGQICAAYMAVLVERGRQFGQYARSHHLSFTFSERGILSRFWGIFFSRPSEEFIFRTFVSYGFVQEKRK